MRRPRILFLDAHDSFSNNITALLSTLLDADVSVLPIDDPSFTLPLSADTHRQHDQQQQQHHRHRHPNGRDGDDDDDPAAYARLAAELRRYDALVCGPGPGSPARPADVGLMRLVWRLADADLLPVLGVCLGFQSLVAACGGDVRRLTGGGLHGMVREVVHRGGGGGGGGGGAGGGAGGDGAGDGERERDGEWDGGADIFAGAGRFRATLYHSLCGDVGQGEEGEEEWDTRRWKPFGRCPDLVPLAWVEEERGVDDQGRAETERILMAVRHRTKPFWGVQYHPESVCTDEEGNKVIRNWFRAAQRWNEARGRVVVRDGQGLARAATRPSLLSQLACLGLESEGGSGSGEWWEGLGTEPVLRSATVSLPRGVQVPDIVDAVDPDGQERIVLDSANASPTTSRADVRGRYSIIAVGVNEALRVEHHTGDDYATVGLRCVRGLPVNLTQQVSLARYGTIWGFVAAFHDSRRLEATEPTVTPFVGGFMGYITYEQGLADIDVSLDHPRPHHRPDVCLSWITKSVVVDHLLGVVHVQQLLSASEEADPWLEETAAKLLTPQTSQRKPSFSSRGEPQLPKARRPSRSTSIQTPLTKEYETKVRICQEYIAAGESYELCLTDQTTITRPLSDRPLGNNAPASAPAAFTPPRKQRRSSSTSSPAPPSSWSLFKLLRSRQPAPFASYLRLGGATLVSASPERFLTYDRGGRCSMRPMKGTVRKSEAVATIAQAERILHVPKEEAENLMIVDLVRHDLHGVCGAGNVEVPELLKVEEYQSVFQMITVVEGQLPAGGGDGKGKADAESEVGGKKRMRSRHTGLDVLAASLPPGSMTGAPKKRSCEILREIEGRTQERGLYSGVVGYMCATGRGDWSVTIRSMFRWDDEQVVVPGEEGDETHEVWRIGAGGAVTILSTPDGEREEMFTKLAGPLRVFAEAC